MASQKANPRGGSAAPPPRLSVEDALEILERLPQSGQMWTQQELDVLRRLWGEFVRRRQIKELVRLWPSLTGVTRTKASMRLMASRQGFGDHEP